MAKEDLYNCVNDIFSSNGKNTDNHSNIPACMYCAYLLFIFIIDHDKRRHEIGCILIKRLHVQNQDY